MSATAEGPSPPGAFWNASMSTPTLYTGCPSWADRAWLGSLFPESARAEDFLALYAGVFNAVEGNTTFYASPPPATVARWREQVTPDFRFCFKLPRAITHELHLRGAEALLAEFLDLLSPLGEHLGPFMIQLPAEFGPADLPVLERFLAGLPADYRFALELRHPAFFDRADAERGLLHCLRQHGVERVCFDSRALFSAPAEGEAVIEAQQRKPRMPVHAQAVTDTPLVRFIGHPELPRNPDFLAPWWRKIAQWLEEGRRPYFFCHMPDNRDAPLLTKLFHEEQQKRTPALPPLPMFPGDVQLDLWGP